MGRKSHETSYKTGDHVLNNPPARFRVRKCLLSEVVNATLRNIKSVFCKCSRQNEVRSIMSQHPANQICLKVHRKHGKVRRYDRRCKQKEGSSRYMPCDVAHGSEGIINNALADLLSLPIRPDTGP